MNILFITANGINDASFGGPKGSIRNYTLLKSYGNVEIYTIKKKSNLQSLLSIFCGYYPPIDESDYKQLLNLSEKSYDLVFFDGSIYGKLVDIFTKSKTVVFYHNCEHDYISVRFGNTFSLKKSIYQKLIDKNEQYITLKANYRVAFSTRDKKRISKLYGKIVEQVMPLGIEDKYRYLPPLKTERKCLLLGTVCKANVEGYSWFIKNVSPYINCKTIIAGKGFEKYKQQWDNKKVEVIGYVKDLAEIYEQAEFVAIPLFSGGGMKVKTVEALMYGKTIFGTDEAFSGFEINLDGVGSICNDQDTFILKINEYLESKHERYNDKARKIYKNYYSIKSCELSFQEMMKNLKLIGAKK